MLVHEMLAGIWRLIRAYLRASTNEQDAQNSHKDSSETHGDPAVRRNELNGGPCCRTKASDGGRDGDLNISPSGVNPSKPS